MPTTLSEPRSAPAVAATSAASDQPAAAARTPAPPPGSCAGLRSTLLRLAGDRFPIEPSPFQPLARRLGGSLREVLSHCQALVAQGATPGLRVRWDAGLQRCNARLLLRDRYWPLDNKDAAAWRARLPALAAWHVVEAAMTPTGDDDRAAWPSGWLDLFALDPARLQTELDRLFAATPGVPWEASSCAAATTVPMACGCAQGSGPCSDPALAALCEAGLPVVAHPYRALAQQLGRSERDVVQALRRWRESGRLATLGLAPGAEAGHSVLHLAALALEEAPAGLAATLAARPGVSGLAGSLSRPHVGAPYTLLALNLAPQATAPMVAQVLHAAGLDPWVRAHLKVHHWQLRPAPLLFSTPAPAAAAARQSG